MTDHLTVTTPAGRTLRVHSAGGPAHPCVFVLHGSPSSGMLYPPNVEDAAAHGLRLVSYDRPRYGGSTPHPGHYDRFVPVSHGEWLVAQIPAAEAHISAEEGHLTLLHPRRQGVPRLVRRVAGGLAAG